MLKLVKDLGRLYPKKDSKQKFRYGMYECDCGDTVKLMTSRVNRGKAISCPKCSMKRVGESRSTHGDTGTSLHNRWLGMKGRCYNKNNHAYEFYGAKGVTVCDEWKNSYESFKAWSLVNGYKDDLQIDKDRLSKELNVSPQIYSPKTCEWVTSQENVLHLCNSVMMTLNGKTKNMSVWCKELGIDRRLVSARLKRGWGDEDALTLPTIADGYQLGKNEKYNTKKDTK